MENCEYSIVGSELNHRDSDVKKMPSKWEKFKLLMWKNYLLQYRNPYQTILEIFIPVMFSGLLVLIRSLVTPDIFPNPMIFEPVKLNTLMDSLKLEKQLTRKILSFKNVDISKFTNFSNEIVYSPQNEQLEMLMRNFEPMVKPLLKVTSVPSSAQLAPYLRQKFAYAGIQFPDEYANLTELPDDLKYSIRYPAELRRTDNVINPLYFNWRTDFLFPLFQPGGARNHHHPHDGSPSGYYMEGFLFLQQFMFRSFMALKSTSDVKINDIPKIYIRRFPYPPFVYDLLLQGLQALISLFILLSFVYPCINIIKYVTTEKEKQLKEAMKIMGLDSWLHWTAWSTKCFIYMLITVIIMTTLFKVRWYGEDNPNAVFTYGSWSVIWFFLMLYSISTITFCFMLSVFFSKASTASAVGGLVWFLAYSPYSFIQQRYDAISLSVKLVLSLLSNTAMAIGFNVIVKYEGTQEGIQWSNVFKPVSVDDNFNLGYVWIMLIVDTIIYMLIALYVEKIFPGDFGVAEKWNFPFSKKFWFNIPDYIGIHDINANGSHVNANYEHEPKNKNPGIRIMNLRKVYDENKVAVEGLNLNLYENEITALLGQNGAGKTTTMSMLTGMINPSSGTAIIDGKDIRKEMNSIRSTIGFCPQHNILFDSLTVREHLTFFSLLKGLHKDEIEREVEKYVKLLKLETKIDTQSKGLSGGMKRKLSVGIALCANSRIVLFDEPSSGVDPSARRDLWDMLQKEKDGRTILLSTHFMLEADVLGDRIAIMSNGALKAVGTPFFLKKQFGVGYHLVCVKKESFFNSSNVTELLKKYIPDIKKESEIGTELSYLLDDRNVLVFQNMLQDLEENSEQLNIESYGISLTTLEEVFLKVGSDNVEEIIPDTPPKINGHSAFQVENEQNGNFYNYSDHLTLLEGPALYLNQMRALLKKKMLHSKRNFVLLIIQILIPVSFVTITILTVRSWGGNKDLPKLTLSIDTYKSTVTTLQVDPTLFADSMSNKIFNNYRSQFKSFKSDSRLDVITRDMIEYYLDTSKQFLARLNEKFLYGATIGESNITIWFNNQPYHALPISLSLIHDAILTTVSNKSCKITVANEPLPYLAESKMMMLQAGNNMGFQLSFNIGFAMAFVASFFVIAYIKERSTKAKHLQFVSGVSSITYWLSSFIWDFIIFFGVAFLMSLTIGIFQEKGFSTTEELGRMFFVFILFGFAVLPFLYISAFMFSSAASGFTKMSVLFIFFGVAMYTVIFSMRFEGFNLAHVADKLTWIFLAVPHFSLSNAITNINLVNVFKEVCFQQCNLLGICDKEKLCEFNARCCSLDYYAWKEPGIGRNIFYFLMVGIFAFCILFLIEFRVFEVLYYFIRKSYRGTAEILCPLFLKRPPNLDNSEEEDVDVKNEKEKVNNMEVSVYNDYSLVLKNVSKYYKDFLAVNQLCIGIKPGECFGLLGVNGAGKTSTFKMLTGDIKISNGEAYVNGINLKMKMKNVHKVTGYCPQFDALIDDLTGRETLVLFALSRGIPESKLKEVIAKLANDFNFTKHLDKLVKALSGGNKRKLSTAVALLGNPKVIYLDEMSTGMDVASKRNIWDVMCKVRKAGKTIVLTTHSMEESEALCTKLAIMVNGRFKCLGSTQHLKSKFGQGFVLTVKLKRTTSEGDEKDDMNDERNQVKEYVEQEFTGAELKEEYYDLMTFYVPSRDGIKWSQIFGKLQEAKNPYGIEDYSIAQSSLEQIFLSFTKYQRGGND